MSAFMKRETIYEALARRLRRTPTDEEHVKELEIALDAKLLIIIGDKCYWRRREEDKQWKNTIRGPYRSQ